MRLLRKMPGFNAGETVGMPFAKARELKQANPPIVEIVSGLDELGEIDFKLMGLDRQIPALQKAAEQAAVRLTAATEARAALVAQREALAPVVAAEQAATATEATATEGGDAGAQDAPSATDAPETSKTTTGRSSKAK